MMASVHGWNWLKLNPLQPINTPQVGTGAYLLKLFINKSCSWCNTGSAGLDSYVLLMPPHYFIRSSIF